MDRRQREMLDAVELEMHRFLEAKRKNNQYRTDLRFEMEIISLHQLKLVINNACDFGYMILKSCNTSLEKIIVVLSDKHTKEKMF